jgi:hypothetical protein
MKRLAAVLMLSLTAQSPAWAWGQEGHSIVAEIAQRRLSPAATVGIARLLGANHSLASISSWADDVRDARPETYNWHFVDLPIDSSKYDPGTQCEASPKGDCIVAELTRLQHDLRCAPTDDLKREALRFVVHFVGDIHQPLHTVLEARGGNDIQVRVKLRGALTCREGPCQPYTANSNFHRVWDSVLITRTTWNWGAYVNRLENGWLMTPDAKRLPATVSFEGWAEETHRAAQTIWKLLPESRQVDDSYYQAVLPVLDRQLGIAGVRLAVLLNTVYGSNQCPAR